MVRRYVAPILRVGLFILILMAPLLLAAIAQRGGARRALGGLPPGPRPGGETERPLAGGARLPASAPATVIEARDGKLLVEAVISGRPVRGWAEAGAFVVLDGPEQNVAALVASAKLLLAANDRPVLTAAYLREAVLRDASNAEAWVLLGRTGERIAASARIGDDGRPSSSAALAGLWGVGLIPGPDGRSFRYDGEAYRRAIALGPPPELAEEARVRLLVACGPAIDAKAPPTCRPPSSANGTSASTSPRFPPRLAVSVPDRAVAAPRPPCGRPREAGPAEATQAARDAALEAASEASVVAPDVAKKRSADRLIARLTKSFPRKLESDKPVGSPAGYRAAIVVRGGKTLLTVTKPNGREAIQPLPVRGADPATLAFDATGVRLAWDESPEPGRRRTRVSRPYAGRRRRARRPRRAGAPGRVGRPRRPGPIPPPPTATHLPRLLAGRAVPPRRPRGLHGGRLPDPAPARSLRRGREGEAGARERPFSAPGVVDWARVTMQAAKLSG